MALCSCRLAVSAIKQLHPDVISSVQAKALYSKEEEKLLGTIPSVCIYIVQPVVLKS